MHLVQLPLIETGIILSKNLSLSLAGETQDVLIFFKNLIKLLVK